MAKLGLLALGFAATAAVGSDEPATTGGFTRITLQLEADDGERFPLPPEAADLEQGESLAATSPAGKSVRIERTADGLAITIAGDAEIDRVSNKLLAVLRDPAAPRAFSGLAPRGADRGAAGSLYREVELPMRALRLADAGGSPWTVDRHAGATVVLSLWATWCKPCHIELDDLADLVASERGSGLTVYAVNVNERREVATAFLESAGLSSLPSLFATTEDLSAAWRGFEVRLPQLWIIDGTGTLRRVASGFATVGKVAWTAELLDTIEGLGEGP